MQQSEAEWTEIIRRSVETGVPLLVDFFDDGLSGKNLASRAWSGGDFIPAMALETVLSDSDIVAHPDGLTIIGARIVGGLTVRNCEISYSVHFSKCAFEDNLVLDRSRWQHFVLSHCVTRDIALDGTQFNGNFFIDDTFVLGRVQGSSLVVNGQFSIERSYIAGRDGRAIDLNTLQASSGVFLEALECAGETAFVSANITGSLYFRDAVLSNPIDTALNLAGLKCTDDLVLEGARVSGSVRVTAASLGGNFRAANATFRTPLSTAINLRNIEVAGTFDMLDAQTVGEASMTSMKIGGNALFARYRATNEGARALTLNYSSVGGNLLLSDSVLAGQLSATDLVIAGFLGMNRSLIRHPLDQALIRDRSKVVGSLLLDNSNFYGESRILAVEIGGNLSAEKTHFANSFGLAVGLDHTNVAHYVNFEALDVEGEFRMCGATVKGQFWMDGSELSLARASSILLDGTSVSGSATLVDLRVSGDVDLVDSTFESRLSVTIAEAQPSIRDLTVDLEGSRVAHLHVFSSVQKIRLDVNNARIESLHLDKPETLRLAHAYGWSLGSVHGALLTDPTSAITLLETLSKQKTNRFVSQPWSELARSIGDGGRAEIAKSINNRAAWHAAKASRGGMRVRRIAYGLLVGHGYYPWQIIYWLVGIYAIALVACAIFANTFVPSDWRAFEGSILPAGYPAFIPWLYAIDIAVPVANTGQNSAWRLPADSALNVLLTGLKISSYVLVTMFVAGVTGLLKRN